MKKYINPEIEILSNMDMPAFPRRGAADYSEKLAAYMAAREKVKAQARRVVAAGVAIMASVPYCHATMTETLFQSVFGISFSVMTGKLEHIRSINSAVTENPICLDRMQQPGTICGECYAETLLSGRKGLRDNTELNGRILSAAVIPAEYWPVLAFDTIFRIESFADVSNVTHAVNYINFMVRNSSVKFGVWTKNPALWAMALKSAGGDYLRMDNVSFGVSSRCINKRDDVAAIKKRFPFVNFIFTVYDLYEAANNDIDITCGGRKCIECRVCYEANEAGDVVIVNELLKSHQTVARNAFHDRRRVFKLNLKHNAGGNKPEKVKLMNHAAESMLAYIDKLVARGVVKIA